MNLLDDLINKAQVQYYKRVDEEIRKMLDMGLEIEDLVWIEYEPQWKKEPRQMERRFIILPKGLVEEYMKKETKKEFPKYLEVFEEDDDCRPNKTYYAVNRVSNDIKDLMKEIEKDDLDLQDGSAIYKLYSVGRVKMMWEVINERGD